MTVSVRESILQNVHTTLQGVKTSAGYNNTLARVERVDFTDYTTGPFPSAFVHEPDDTYRLEASRGGHDVLHSDMALDVWVAIQKPGADKATPINSVITDVLRAMLADGTRGGNAVTTDIARVSVSVLDEGMALSAARLSWIIYYRHRRTDPRIKT